MERHAKCVDLLWSLILIVPWIKHMEMLLTFLWTISKHLETIVKGRHQHRKTRTPHRAMNQSRFFFLLFSLHRWKMLKVSKVLRRFWTSWNDGMVLPVLHGKAPHVVVRVVLFFDVVLAYRATALFAPWNLTLAARAPRKLFQGPSSQETSQTCPNFLSAVVKKNNLKGVATLQWNSIVEVSNHQILESAINMFLLNSFFGHTPLHLSVDTGLGKTPYPRTFEDDAQVYQCY